MCKSSGNDYRVKLSILLIIYAESKSFSINDHFYELDPLY